MSTRIFLESVSLMQHMNIFHDKVHIYNFPKWMTTMNSPRYIVFSLENKNLHYTLCKKISEINIF